MLSKKTQVRVGSLVVEHKFTLCQVCSNNGKRKSTLGVAHESFLVMLAECSSVDLSQIEP